MTGQLYNIANKQCLSFGITEDKQGIWVPCNPKDNTQQLQMVHNRLQYIDKAALDISKPTLFNATILPSTDPNFKNQYINFIY